MTIKRTTQSYDHCFGFFCIPFEHIFVCSHVGPLREFTFHSVNGHFLMERTKWMRHFNKHTISMWSHTQFAVESAFEQTIAKWHIQLNERKQQQQNVRIQTGFFSQQISTFCCEFQKLITSAIDCVLSKTGRIYIHFELTFRVYQTAVVHGVSLNWYQIL